MAILQTQERRFYVGKKAFREVVEDEKTQIDFPQIAEEDLS